MKREGRGHSPGKGWWWAGHWQIQGTEKISVAGGPRIRVGLVEGGRGALEGQSTWVFLVGSGRDFCLSPEQ